MKRGDAWGGAALWNYASYLAGKGLAFLSTMLLARLLVPEDFGLLAIGMVAITYFDAIADLGVGSAVIYRQEDPERSADTAFWLSLLIGLAFGAAAFFAAAPVAAFFKEPRAVAVVRALAFTIPLAALGSIHEARLKKTLDFRRRFLPVTGHALVKGLTAVGLAGLGFGVWSLVWAQVAGTAASSILFWIALPWRPRPRLDLPATRAMLGYGSHITLVDAVGVVDRNVDYLIVGERLGAAALGYYSFAFRLPELLILNTCYMVGQAVFPAYSRLQSDLTALRAAFLETLHYVSLMTVPAGVGLMLLSSEFIEVFFGERWAEAVPAMQAVALYAVIYSLSFNSGDVYKAIGRPSILSRVALLKLLITVPLLWWSAGRGIGFVAVGQVVAIALITVLRLGIVMRVADIRAGALLNSVRPALLATTVMFLGCQAALTRLDGVDAAARLVGVVLLGAALYAGALWLTDPEPMRRAFAFVARRMAIGPQAPA